MKKTDPLLDEGMVALLRWLEKTSPRILTEIHGKCLETAGDHATVYERKRSADDWIEINHRDNPEDPSDRMILVADIYGDGWTIAHEIFVIGRRLLPQSSQTMLCDPDCTVEADSIMKHPYLTGAKAGGGKKKPNLLLQLYREPAGHVLTSKGIEALP